MSTDFDDRELCPDGACIGVIGPDGRCKECGKPGTKPASSAPAPRPDSEDGDDLLEAADALAEAAPESDDEADAPAVTDSGGQDPAWDDRALCSDGACIGVIGPDGRCRECGKPA